MWTHIRRQIPKERQNIYAELIKNFSEKKWAHLFDIFAICILKKYI